MSDIALIRKTVMSLEAQVRDLSDSLSAIKMEVNQRNTEAQLAEVRRAEMAASANMAIAASSSNSTEQQQHLQHNELSDDMPLTGNTSPQNQSTTTPTVAEVVKLNRDCLENFSTVSRKSRKTKKVIVGNAVNVSALKGVAQKSVVSINRLELGTTVDDVQSHLKSFGVNVISCFDLSLSPNWKNTNVKSMRLCISRAQLSHVFDANVRPEDVVIQAHIQYRWSITNFEEEEVRPLLCNWRQTAWLTDVFVKLP